MTPLASILNLCLSLATAACDNDDRLNGRDVQAFALCCVNGGAGCLCWDLSDDGALTAADLTLLVNTMLGDLPFAVANTATLNSGAQVSLNVLDNDLNPHGPGLTAQIETNPLHGTVNLDPDGLATYTAHANYGGPDSFTYRAVNAFGASQPGTVHIFINLVCPPGFANCDGQPSNGCEASLTSNGNCGNCGIACANPHGTTDCSTGVCIPTCVGLWKDCDGNPNNGCETQVNTVTNCGDCGVSCNLANASESCSTGSCQLVGCNQNFSNCDGNNTNGCEVNHATYASTCGAAIYVGSFCGDANAGGGFPPCLPTSFQHFSTVTFRQSAWFRGRALECSNCVASIQARATLTVPAGINYDLYGYLACGTVFASSTNGAGVTDQILLFRSDNTGAVDDFDYWVEVRFASGSSCSNWTLNFEGRN